DHRSGQRPAGHSAGRAVDGAAAGAAGPGAGTARLVVGGRGHGGGIARRRSDDRTGGTAATREVTGRRRIPRLSVDALPTRGRTSVRSSADAAQHLVHELARESASSLARTRATCATTGRNTHQMPIHSVATSPFRERNDHIGDLTHNGRHSSPLISPDDDVGGNGGKGAHHKPTRHGPPRPNALSVY